MPPQNATDARERLLSAAQSLFAEAGVAATTPREVLERSGIGQGSLYHHFPAKRDLAQAAIERTAHEQLVAASSVFNSDLTAADSVRGYLLRERDALAGCRVGRLTADPVVMADDTLREPLEGYFTGLMGVIEGVLEDTGLPADRARDRASAIVAVVQGGYVLARATGDAEWMRSAVRGMTQLLGENDDEH